MTKSTVSIVKGSDPEQMIEKALSLLGGVELLIKRGSTVIVKPNVGHEFGPETSVCTSPQVVEATIKVLRKAKPKEIILAEAAAIGCDTLDCYEVSGVREAAEKAGVDRIIDIKREEDDLIKVPIRKARSDITRIKLPRWLLEADHIVNLPIFKTHSCMLFTCALKNIKGLVEDKVHYQMHQTDLAAAMADVWTVVQADLSIADIIRPAEGFGPHNTIPTGFGCIAASKDPVALDATACRMTGLDIDKVHYFESFRERGIGQFEEDKIEILGETIEAVFKQLWFPYLGDFKQWPEYNIHADGACSSCETLLAFTLEWLKAIGHYENNSGISIVLGRTKKLPKVDDPRNLILMGDCVRRFKDQGVFAGGCPPIELLPLLPIIERRSMDSISDIAGSEDPEAVEAGRAMMKALQESFVEYAKVEREKFLQATGRER